MILRIDQPIRSLNHWLRVNWRCRHKESKLWEQLIWAEFKGKPPATVGKVRVKITSHRKNELDKDNLHGGVKGLVDALKRLRIIEDDCPDLLDLEVVQKKVYGSDCFTEIELTMA